MAIAPYKSKFSENEAEKEYLSEEEIEEAVEYELIDGMSKPDSDLLIELLSGKTTIKKVIEDMRAGIKKGKGKV